MTTTVKIENTSVPNASHSHDVEIVQTYQDGVAISHGTLKPGEIATVHVHDGNLFTIKEVPLPTS